MPTEGELGIERARWRCRLWAVPDVAALYAHFETIRSYVESDTERFAASLERTRELTATSRHDGDDSRAASLLLNVLECNHKLSEGDADKAAERYAVLVEREERRHAGTRNDPRNAARGERQHELVLAILHQNLATCLRRKGASRREIEGQYDRALELCPELAMTWDTIADFHLDGERWDEARRAFRSGAVLRSAGRDDKLLNAYLAHTYLQQSEVIAEKGIRSDAAEPEPAPERHSGVLRRALEALTGAAPSTPPNAPDQSSPPARRIEGATPEAREAALSILDDALRDLSFREIPDWQGTVHLERARLLDQLGRYGEACEAWRQAAECFDHASGSLRMSLTTRQKWADRAAEEGALAEAARLYCEGLDVFGRAGSAQKDAADLERDLLARVAILNVAKGSATRHQELIERWKAEDYLGNEGWGPYYDALARSRPLLGNPAIRDGAHVRYHDLLAASTSLVDDRDLTAAILELYKLEQQDIDREAGEPGVVADPSDVANSLHVAAPLALEISAEYAADENVDDDAVTVHGNAMRETVEARYGLKLPGVRVRGDEGCVRTFYSVMIHEQVVATGLSQGDVLADAFAALDGQVAANLEELLGHQEVQNFLERNELVKPTLEDIAEKENRRHMQPLVGVLRALVSERVPLREHREIYETFRDGWLTHLPLAQIVERVRLLPAVRPTLWGNAPGYGHALVSDSLERWIECRVHWRDDAPILALEAGEVERLRDAVASQVAALTQPALIVRQQSLRALMRSLIAPKLPEVPVLSLQEITFDSGLQRLPELSICEEVGLGD